MIVLRFAIFLLLFELPTFVTFLPFRRCWTIICPVAWNHVCIEANNNLIDNHDDDNINNEDDEDKSMKNMMTMMITMRGNYLSESSHRCIELSDPIPLVSICLLPSHLDCDRDHGDDVIIDDCDDGNVINASDSSSLAVTFAFAPFPLTDHDCDHGEEADSGLQRMVLAEKR